MPHRLNGPAIRISCSRRSSSSPTRSGTRFAIAWTSPTERLFSRDCRRCPQLAAVCLLALKLGGVRSPDGELRKRVVRDLQAVRSLMERVLELNETVRSLAERFAHRHDFLYLGRGLQYPLALEGALKLKEIS